jgi:arachidonate 15-lipoxygenase
LWTWLKTLAWKPRKAFWNAFTVVKFKANKPRTIPVPVKDKHRLVPIPLSKRYPSIPIEGIPVADHVPPDENSPARLRFCKTQAWLYRHFSPQQRGLPEVNDDPEKAIDEAFGPAHRWAFHRPHRPKEYEHPVDLGELTVAGPYACYLEKVEGEAFQWDLTGLDEFEVHRGLYPLGAAVRFELDRGAHRLSPVEIDCELGVCKPDDPDWELARKIALCAATNHLSLVRHFNWIHLTAVSQFTIATRNNLPRDHPVRRLLWPHMWGTEYSNELVTEILLMPGGDFETVFSFTHAGLCDLFEHSFSNYDVRVIDPESDAACRRIVNEGFDLPYLDNRLAHFTVMHDHTCRYLDLYYETDQQLHEDRALVDWFSELGRRIPHGIGKLVGTGLTKAGLARLTAGFIYLGSVEHEVLGTALWNYQLWSDVQPTRVYRSGRRERLDVYQRLVNYNFMLNVSRAPLLQDFSYMAVDRDGRREFQTFLRELCHLQRRLDQEARAFWKVSPEILESGVNG